MKLCQVWRENKHVLVLLFWRLHVKVTVW